MSEPPSSSLPASVEEEVARILATSPITYDAFQVIPADGEYPLVVSIARAWPRPAFRSWGVTPGRWMSRSLLIPVQVTDPDYEPGAYSDVDGWNRPIAELVRRVPEEIREAVRPLPCCYQWYCIKLLAEVPEFLDLVVEQPVLAAILANQLHPRGDDVPEALGELRRLLSRPRRRLLALLELPEERWILRVLAKIDFFGLLSPGPAAITDLLQSDCEYIRSRLRHLPRLRADVLQILADPDIRPMTTFELLADDDTDDIWNETSLRGLLVELHGARDDGRAARKPAAFKTRNQVLDAWRAIEPFDPFPDAFEAPTDEVKLRLSAEPTITLTPLLAAGDVYEHGIAQANCLASDKQYYEDVSTGYTALYEVRWQLPGDGEAEMATLSIKQRWDAMWEVLQLLGVKNQPVPAWLLLRISDWVDQLNRPDEDLDSPPPAWLIEQEEDEGVEQLVLPLAWRSRPPTPMEVPCSL